MPDNSSVIFTDSQTPPGRLGLLGALRPRSRLAAIAETIGVASAREAEFLGDELIRVSARLASHTERGRTAIPSAPRSRLLGAALGALAEAWPCLTGAQRRAANELLSAPGASSQWRRLLRERAEASDPAARRAAALAIGDCPSARTTCLLATLLADTDRSVADAAEHALRKVVDGALAAPGGTLPDPATEDELETTLADAARAFPDHRRRGVLESAALLLTPARFGGAAPPGGQPTSVSHGSLLVRWFAGGEDESHLSLRAVIRRSADPRMRARAWEWLGGAGRRAESVAAAALDRVSNASSVEDHEALLTRTHLLANPARAHRVGMIGTHGSRRPAGTMIPDAGTINRLGLGARRGVPRLAAAMRLTDEARANALAPLLNDADPLVRFAAMRALPPRPPGGDTPGPDPWDPSSEAARLGAHRLVRDDRDLFVAGLAARAGSGDHAVAVGAIVLARRLSLVPEIEIEVLKVLASQPGGNPNRDPSQLGPLDAGPERVAATAAAALGDLDTESAHAALRVCIAHPVPRVRANAVEALGRIARRRAGRTGDLATADPAAYASLIDLKSDGQHRVRANALRALLAGPSADTHLDEPAAEDELAGMLGDDRAPHRAAALWLAERLLARGGRAGGWRHWNLLATRIAESARAETDPIVRVRAERCARRVLTAVRTDWRDRAAPVGDGRGGPR